MTGIRISIVANETIMNEEYTAKTEDDLLTFIKKGGRERREKGGGRGRKPSGIEFTARIAWSIRFG